MAKHSHGPLLERAATIVGGEAKLREYLNVTPERYSLWREGTAPLPWELFLKTVDLLSDYYDEQIRRQRNGHDTHRVLMRDSHRLMARAGDLVETAQRSKDASLRVSEKARMLRGVSISLRLKLAAERNPQGKQPSVNHALFNPEYVPQTRGELMESALDAALTVTGTDLGDIQLVDAQGYPHVEARRGFPVELDDALTTLEIGLSEVRPVFLPDLATDPVFAATLEGESIIKAGARAMACAPIVHQSGLLLGSICTHFREPHKRDTATLALLQLVGRRTASWLDARPTP
jgi:hypothetical protein